MNKMIRHFRTYLSITLFGLALHGNGQVSDIQILKSINNYENTGLDNFAKAASNSVTPISIGAPVGMFVVGLINHDKVLLNKSYVTGFAFGATIVETYALKWLVGRPRPYITYPNDVRALEPESSASFPSGHTSAAFQTATSLSLLYPKWYVIVPSYAWAATVGYSRMRLGVHYPTDVLVGAVLGIGTAWLTYKGSQWLHITVR